MNNVVSACVADLQAKVQTVDGFADRTFYIYDQAQFVQQFASLKNPGAAVIYDGAKSQGGPGGLNARLQFSIYVMAGDTYLERIGKEDKDSITGLLDGIRNAVKLQQSPTGHKWTFVMEVPIDLNGKQLFYVQRWATDAPLT